MYRIYQVEYGDTLDKIANKVGSSTDDIKTINGFNSDADLIVGSLIVVPKEENQVFSSYKVKKGDSLYEIAKANNISVDLLSQVNGLEKDEYIYIVLVKALTGLGRIARKITRYENGRDYILYILLCMGSAISISLLRYPLAELNIVISAF